MVLAEYDIMYMTRKVMRRSVIANHLSDNAIEDYESLNFDFLNEDVLVVEKEEKLDLWTMYFDRVVNIHGNGVGVVIISHNRKQYFVSIKLQFECTNNMSKYEACIL